MHPDANRTMIGLDIGCKKRLLFPYALGVDITPLCRDGDPMILDGAEVYGPTGRNSKEKRIAEAMHPVNAICCDAQSLPMFADGALDYILASHSLEHISSDPGAVLTEWGRVLRPGGLLLVAVPTGETGPRFGASMLDGEFKTLEDVPRVRARDIHRCALTEETLTAYLWIAGFDIPFHVDADETEIEMATYRRAHDA